MHHECHTCSARGMSVSTCFFFNDTATTEIYTLSLHDALPICGREAKPSLKLGVCGEHGGDPKSIAFFHELGLDYVSCSPFRVPVARLVAAQVASSAQSGKVVSAGRSEEHTSELQSRQYLVCRLLLEKKKSIPSSLTTCVILSVPPSRPLCLNII